MGFKVTSSDLGNVIGRAKNANFNMWKGCKRLIQEVESVGADTASQMIATAYVDVDYAGLSLIPDLKIEHASKISADGAHCSVSMVGKEAPFVEFGAGVYINNGRTYPGDRPAEIVGLGQYGFGLGRRKAWAFYVDDIPTKEMAYLTTGTPMQHPMYDTAKAMRRVIKAKRFKELMK